jgi:hypothetical protein
MLGAFVAFALLLAAGVYGVMSHLVSQSRTISASALL